MLNSNQIRQKVSESYTRALQKKGSSCCGTVSQCCGDDFPKSRVESLGYDEQSVADLPKEAVESSFGCGNPLAFIGVRPGDVVVDLGSGAGLDLLVAAKSVGPTGRVIGVDMTDAMIEKARANIARAGASQVEVRKGTIENLPVASASVDWVISNCVINLSPEKYKVFSEIARVLKPGGQMQVSDIVARDLPRWARGSIASYSACVGGALSEQEFVEGLQKAGLQGVEVRERLVYAPEQIAAWTEAALPWFLSQRLRRWLAGWVGRRLSGQIWSARFYAKKI